MKFLASQLSTLLSDQKARRDLRALGKYVAVLAGVIALFTAVFHAIMVYEGQQHSWLTGLYWTLTVMSTLGFGDITFSSDLGRAFTVLVLLTGILMLLIVLPFVFIRFFYAPWMEAQMRSKTPRAVPDDLEGHVLICSYGPISRDLIERLKLLAIPYYVFEPDMAQAAELAGQRVEVLARDPEMVESWQAARAGAARAVFANLDDIHNTNVTVTLRQSFPDVPIVATADNEESVDILELAGASEVLLLKERLGAHLANRVNAGHAEAHVIGRFEGLTIAEFPVHRTPLVGKTIRETRLREVIGINVVGVWTRGRFELAQPETLLSEFSVPVVIGTQEQIDELNALLVIYDTNYAPTLVLGGGKVGCAAARALREREIPVHIVERDAALATSIEDCADRVIVGDAADLKVLHRAGIAEAPAVLLTTNDDATNIYLAVYCRRLNADLRIISRITDHRNLEAIHRAGADFVLSEASLWSESVIAAIEDREMMMLGSGLELFHVPVPDSIADETLVASEIGARTGLNVIAVKGDELHANPAATTTLPAGADLLMLGTPEQIVAFSRAFQA